MSNIDIYSCTDTSTAQRLVNTLSDQVIQCINEACECVSRETKSTAKPPSKRKPKITAIHLDRAFPKLTYLRLSTETNT